MEYALIHGKILDGSEGMKVQEGNCILTEGENM